MVRFRFLRFAACLAVLSVFTVNSGAQMPQRNVNQVSVTGWTDDTHYIIRDFDSEKNLVTRSVDIKTGKGVVIQPALSDREILGKTLPSGTTLGMRDVISPDRNSVAIIKDNDIFFFSAGDKELKKTHLR